MQSYDMGLHVYRGKSQKYYHWSFILNTLEWCSLRITIQIYTEIIYKTLYERSVQLELVVLCKKN